MYRKDCVVFREEAQYSLCTERTVLFLERRPSLHCVQKGLCCFREEAQSSLCTERTVLF